MVCCTAHCRRIPRGSVEVVVAIYSDGEAAEVPRPERRTPGPIRKYVLGDLGSARPNPEILSQLMQDCEESGRCRRSQGRERCI